MAAAVYAILSDGAPLDARDAQRAGFKKRADYARARRAELDRVFSLCGVPQERVRRLDFADQRLCFHLLEVTEALVRLLEECRPQLVVTHPYEGGHPDHDAAALAVRLACGMLPPSAGPAPDIVEMTSYHLCGGRWQVGTFLPYEDCTPLVISLSQVERRLKCGLLDCYETQRETLALFQLDSESFRFAPQYNFTAPPHDGPLLYELYDWGVNGARWREFAEAALRRLENPCR
jgi:hypothetical protein